MAQYQAWARSFSGCGHAPHLEAPEAYAQEVLTFLQASPLPLDDGRTFEQQEQTG